MSEKRFEWIDKDTISDNQTDEWYCFLFDDIRDDFVDLLNELNDENDVLKQQLQTRHIVNKQYEEIQRLRELIKKNVFGMYEEGSLTDLEFKSIAYDDIVKLELANESELKVIVICKQGKKENVQSFCQMFIPFGIDYEIKEVS